MKEPFGIGSCKSVRADYKGRSTLRGMLSCAWLARKWPGTMGECLAGSRHGKWFDRPLWAIITCVRRRQAWTNDRNPSTARRGRRRSSWARLFGMREIPAQVYQSTSRSLCCLDTRIDHHCYSLQWQSGKVAILGSKVDPFLVDSLAPQPLLYRVLDCGIITLHPQPRRL